jgi:hypothetical protein
MNENEWEQVNTSPNGSTTERLKIDGGWLYHVSIKSHLKVFHTTMCFVPNSISDSSLGTTTENLMAGAIM